MSDYIFWKEEKGFYFYKGEETAFVCRSRAEEELSFAGCIKREGCFVFPGEGGLPDTVELAACFGMQPVHTAFLWIENPAQPHVQWRIQKVLGEPDESGRRLYRGQGMAYVNYRLLFPWPGRAVWCGEEGCIRFERDGADASACLYALESGERFEIADCRLWMKGEKAGILTGELKIEAGKSGAFFRSMGACIRYQSVCEVRKTRRDNLCTVSLYPGLEDGRGESFLFSFDGAFPLDAARTYIDINAGLCLKGLASTVLGKEIRAESTETTKLVVQKAVMQRVLPDEEGQGKEGKPVFDQCYYWGLSGRIALREKPETLLCGLNGAEYFSMDKAGMAALDLQPGNAAFLYEGELCEAAVTSWIAVEGEGSYIFQKRSMELYSCQNADGALKPYPFPIAGINGSTSAFPYFQYLYGISSGGEKGHIEALEQCLNRVRYDALAGKEKRRQEQEGTVAASGTGLLVKTSSVPGVLSWVGIGNSGNESLPGLRFTGLSEDFSLQLLKGGQAVAVCGRKLCPEVLSVPFAVTQKTAAEIRKREPAIRIESLAGRQFEEAEAFCEALRQLNPQYVENEDWLTLIEETAADCRIRSEGWDFSFSPFAFRTGTENTDTVFFFKYHTGASLEGLAAEGRLSVFGDASVARRCLTAFIAGMQAEDGSCRKGYEDFYQAVCTEDWCGVVALNVPVCTTEMAGELRTVLSSIPEEGLSARCLTLEKAALEAGDGGLKMLPSHISVAVDYEKEKINTRISQPADFAFETTGLKLYISHSVLQSFCSVSEITVNKWFHARAVKEDTTSGNAMVLDGTFQKSRDSGQYLFTLREKAFYKLEGSCMDRVLITSAALISEGELQKIYFGGELHFVTFSSCDLLSYGGENGGLVFENLVLSAKGQKDYRPEYGEILYHPEKSRARSQAFVSRFAADFAGLSYYEAVDIRKMGFHNIICTGIRQSKLKDSFYGMLFQIDLGSLGDLAGSENLMVQLIFAWDIAEETGIYTGIRFSDRTQTDFMLTVQSLLRLGFKTMSLVTGQKGENLEYQLLLRDFSLSFASWSFPPGKNAVFLFADPENPRKLGWYAAYMDEEE